MCNISNGTFPANLKKASQNDVMRLGSKKAAQFVIV